MTLNLLLATVTPAAETVHVEGLISDLAFILTLAALTTVLFKWLRQPVVLGYIVAGFLASPHFEYLPSVTTETNIDFWAQIGIVILLFSLGIEFSFKKLVNAGGSAVVTALIIITGMLGVGWSLGNLMGFSHINSLFLGGMLSMSSTTIILKALSDLNLRHKKFASQVLAVLIVEDLFAVLMMVLLSSIAINKTVEGGELLYSVSKLAFFLIIWFLVGVYILPSLLNSIRGYLNSETLLVISMGLCLGMAVFSVTCGFSLALGAFVMGSILAGTSFAERIERITAPVKDLFGAVFFISVGMMVNPHIIVEYWSPILIFSVTVIVGMIVFGTFGMFVTGQSLLVSMEAGFSLVQIGEFSFIIATLGMSLGVLDANIYPIVVAVSVITTFLTPYFIRLADPAYRLVERLLPEKIRLLMMRYNRQATVHEAQRKSLWATLIKRYLWRVAVYSAILVAISLISLNIFLPWLLKVVPHWGRLICSLVTLAVMAPFLVALTFRSSKKSERDVLLKRNARYDVPMIVMFIFRFILAWWFIVDLLSGIWSRRVGWIMGLAVFAVIFIVLGSHVKKRLSRIESKFFSNLNERDLRKSGKNNNLINDMHLAYMEIGYGCPFVGERLMDADIRRKYGVNVANIQRGNRFIPVARGDMRLFPGDVIGVVGSDADIQKLLAVIETPEPHDPDSDSSILPGNVKLSSVELRDTSPIVGKTISSSGLRNIFSALLVSVQRDEEFVPLKGDLKFCAGDVLWLVCDKHKLPLIRG